MSSDDVRWTGQPSMIDSDNKTKMIRETFVEANVSGLREREAGRGDSNSVKLVCDSSSSNGSASSSLSSKVSKRYDPLISIRRTRSPSIRNRDDNDEEEVNSPKHREQQNFMFVSFYEFLVIVLRFNLNSVATMASIAPRSSKQSIRSKTVVDVDVTPVTQCYRNVAAMLKFSTFFIVLLQVNIVFSYFVIPASAVMVDDSTSGIANSLSDDSGAGEYYDDSVASGGAHYTPTWAVHIPDGEVNGRADQVARDHGFVNFGKIFDDHYHFHHHSVSKRSLNASHHHQERLNDDDRIYWSQQQRILSRRKRDFIRMRPSRMSSVSRIQLNDPKWPQMWYLNRGSGLDMNVIPAWEQGITGKGVVVTILDDGLESDHPDLEHNYDPKASYDVNSHDDDPMPHYDMTDSNRHGTRCAGEVAATANNSLCSVGIAYGAKVGGVRMLDGDVTDAVEARSLALNPQHIDIYSASWGPDDDGKTVDGPGELATRAFIEGVTKGRAGKGSIFIWASGNGGRELDNCNCDGYTNSIWTLSISSATEEGHVPWYSEKCSSTLATTYSSGGPNEKQVVTTDLHHSCTTSHTGTSASAPLAAGIVALVLEANRNLTWRDLQHIVVRTSKPGNLKDPTWVKNGVGRRVSHSFGYGLLDASAMVNLARTWQTVPEQQRCEINAPHVEQMIPAKRYITLQLTVKHCMGVNFLEHVQAKISLTSQRRGDIVIYLQSPAGTRVTLLTSRVHDVSRSGFNEWPFMSVHTWGEAPHGNWLLEIHNEGRFLGYAALKSWSLIFYGTAMPADRNDPIPIRPTEPPQTYSSSSTSLLHHPLYTLPNSNKFPPVSVLTKPVGGSVNSKGKANQGANSSGGVGGGGRKQQQQNHKVSSYGTALSEPKKGGGGGGKGSKNNNSQSGNGKANRKGFTNRPMGGGGGGSKESKLNNLYRLPVTASSGRSSTGGGMRQSFTTLRPKLLQQQSNYNLGLNRNPSSGSAMYKAEKSSRVHDKIAIKAPKQVKDSNGYGGPSTIVPLPITPLHTANEPNSRIPKFFQQYDKIEQIFPEFHPYTGGGTGGGAGGGVLSFRDNMPPTKSIPNKKQYPSFYENSQNREGDSIPQNNAFSNSNRSNQSGRTGGNSGPLVTNPKPSRENSKKFSSSSSSFPGSRNEERVKQTEIAKAGTDAVQKEEIYIPNRKNTKKAQITQWDLIFYGTDMPPENEDPIQIRPGNFGSFGGDLDNNFLQPDSQTAEQWRDMQQNSESHVDIQRTTNDQTNTACTNLLADQRCIECLQATFLYKDRCWTRCPERSYMVPELPYFENRHSNDGREEQSLPRRNIMLPVPQKKCADCHASCLQCRGPESRNCLQCQSGFHLTIVSSDETYCYPAINGNNLSRATSRQGASAEQDENLLNDLRAYAAIVIPAMLIIVGVTMMVVVVRRMIRVRGSQDYAYTQVAFDATNEERQALTTTRNGIQGGPDEKDEHVSNYEIGESSRDWNPKRIEVELSSDSD